MAFGGFGGFGAAAQQQPAPAFGGFGQTSQQPAAGGFGAATGGFGGFGAADASQQQQQQAAGGFGSTAFGGGATGGFGATGAFGQPAAQQQPAFGQAAPAAGGFGGFGQQAAAPQATPSFGGFGAAAQPQQTQSLFGQASSGGTNAFQTPAAGGFGQPAQPAASNAFSLGGFGLGAQQPQQTQSTGFGGFGQAAAPQATASLFGAPTPSTGGFGQPAQQQTGFGLAPSSSGFGGFGAAAAPQQPAATGFGGFGQPQQQQQQQQAAAPQGEQKGTRWKLFTPFVETSTTKVDGVPTTTKSVYQSITCLPEYLHKSFEELRAEDEEIGLAAPVTQPQQAGGGLFGTTSTGFGGFGQPAAAAPQQTSSLFGAPAASTGFGGFGQTAQQPQQTSSLFGAAAQPQQSTSTFGGFGASTGSGFGATGAFGSTAPTASTGFGGFGATPAPAASTGFGGFGAAAQPATTGGFGGGGLFGASTGGGFDLGGATAGNTGSSLFGAAAPSTTGGFGGFGATTTQPAGSSFSLGGASAPAAGSSLFGNTGAATGFGGFGAASSAASTSGFAFPSFSSGAAASQPATGGFGAFGSTAPAAASTSAFGSFGGFGSTPAATGAATGSSLFGAAPAASTGGFGGFGGFGTTTAAPAAASTGFGGFGGFGSAPTTQAAPAAGGLFGQPAAASAPVSQPAQQLVAKVDENNFLSSFLNTSTQQIQKTAVGLSQSQAMMGSSTAGALQSGQFANQTGGAGMPLVSYQPPTPRSYAPGGGASSQLIAHTPRSAARLRPKSYLGSSPSLRAGGAAGGLFSPNQSLALYSPSNLSQSFLHASVSSNQSAAAHAAAALTPELLVSRRNLRKLSHIPLPPTVDLGAEHDEEKTQDAQQAPLARITQVPSSAIKNNVQPSPVRNNADESKESLYPALDRDDHEQSYARSNQATPPQKQQQAPPSATKRDLSRQPSTPQTAEKQAQAQAGRAALAQDDRDALPILTRPDYYTTPSMTILSTWTRAQLERVPNFAVHHSVMGSVSWEGETDVTDLNLDELVLFEQNEKTRACSVEVYPLAADVPPPGCKLNKPAVITVKECWPTGYAPRNNASLSDADVQRKMAKYEKKLHAATERAGAEFLHYKPELGTWSFRVQTFS